jgi:CO/xanthine dehydrogenase FAD-binding subunit
MRYLRPSTVEEAVGSLDSTHGMVLAGGTDACVYMAEGICAPDTLIDISGIESLRGIRSVRDGRDEETIRIGACTTIAEIAMDDGLPTCLRQGAKSVGSPQIRNLGTIGGNVCNASPCGDTLTPLLTLDARFILRSVRGTREVPSEEFFAGPKQTTRAVDEILEFIEFRAPSLRQRSAFRMIGNRKGQAISQVNAALSLTMSGEGTSDVRVAVGSVAPVPLRLRALEGVLSGMRIPDVRLSDIRGPILDGIRPIDDVRSTAKYRQEVTIALVFDVLQECATSEGAGR